MHIWFSALFVVLTAGGAGAQTPDGSALFEMVAPTRPIFSLELSGNALSGHVDRGVLVDPEGYVYQGGGQSLVELERVGDQWSGWFADVFVSETESSPRGDDGAEVIVVSPQTGRVRFVVSRSGDGVVETRQVSHPGHDFSHVHHVGQLSSGEGWIKLGNKVEMSDRDGGTYQGQSNGAQVEQRLESAGTLDPLRLAESDPTLFVLVYYVGFGGLLD